MRFAILVVLAMTGAAFGQSCRHATYQQTYYAPTYHAPTYYTPTYRVPYSDPYALVVGRAFPYYLPLLSYTSVGDDTRDYIRVKNATRDGTLEAFAALSANGAAMPGQPAPAVSPPSFTPAPKDAQQMPATIPPKKDAAVYPTVKLILANRCASCHNPKDNPKHVDLSIDPALISPAVAAWCSTKITLGEMPKKGTPLPQAEFDMMTAWADAKITESMTAAPAAPQPIPPALPKLPPMPADKK